MDTDAIPGFEILNLGTRRFYDAGDFMPEGERQFYRRNARPVMRVGMANAGGANTNKNVAGNNGRDVDLLLFQRRLDCGKTNSFHARRHRSTGILPACYASLTKYFPGNCLTSRFSSRRSRVEETVPLGNLDFVAMASIDVSVVSIAS